MASGATVADRVRGALSNARKDKPEEAESDVAAFIDLLNGMLHYDSTKRLTPHQALAHAFMKEVKPSREKRSSGTPSRCVTVFVANACRLGSLTPSLLLLPACGGHPPSAAPAAARACVPPTRTCP